LYFGGKILIVGKLFMTQRKKTTTPGEERYPILPPGPTPLEAALRVRDREVLEYDSKWGTDVLLSLATPGTAAKFAKVRNRLDAAIDAHNRAVEAAEAQVQADIAINTIPVELRGLKALEEEAIAAGREPLDPGRYWAFSLPDGTQAVLVQTDDDARAAARSPRFKGWAVYSVREMALMISDRALLGVLDAKKLFSEATLESIKPPVDWKRGDEVGL
jgi:hypothetical protein